MNFIVYKTRQHYFGLLVLVMHCPNVKKMYPYTMNIHNIQIAINIAT